MAQIDYLPQLQAGLTVTGQVTLYDPATGAPLGRAVLQRATPANASLTAPDGTPMLLRQYVVPIDPRTPAQQARRAWLAARVALYKADPAAARAAAAAIAAARRITPYQAFIGMDRIAPPLPQGTRWDAGATRWDNGATLWDIAP